MSFLERLFPKNTPITSTSIRDEISRTESELANVHDQLTAVFDGLATMTDDQHEAAEKKSAGLKRARARLEARIKELTNELPAIQAAEDATAKAAADGALRQRAEACRKANTIEAKKLLAEYDKLAAAMGGVFARLSGDRRRNQCSQRRVAFESHRGERIALRCNSSKQYCCGSLRRAHHGAGMGHKDAPTQRGQVDVGDIETAICATMGVDGAGLAASITTRSGRSIEPDWNSVRSQLNG